MPQHCRAHDPRTRKAAVERDRTVREGQGRLVALTTPAGKRGWFYEAWISDSPWHRVKVPASMCPRISQEFLDEELRELGASRFSEEYQLEFIDPDTAAFPTDIISRCFTALVKPLWG